MTTLNLDHISFIGAEPTRGSRNAGASCLGEVQPIWARRNDTERLDPLADWILRRAALDPRSYRTPVLNRRMAACHRCLETTDFDTARNRMQAEPDLFAAALDTLLIGVTEFFRDRRVFDYLKRAVLPELVDSRLGVRVYAPGVSGGHELYSVAILLAELGALERSELLGIDCRPEAVAAARLGVFPDASLRVVLPHWRIRYFEPTGSTWQVRPNLSRHVRFREANLFAFSELASWDLILFRNVGIYFDDAHASRAWDILSDQLAPGGYLVTGKAEKPPAHLPLMRVAPSVYRKELA